VIALDFAQQYGGNATDIVRSSYDIQSAIAGLRGDELARFTASANLAAKATKASAAEVTSFYGTMFGIFEKDAVELAPSVMTSIATSSASVLAPVAVSVSTSPTAEPDCVTVIAIPVIATVASSAVIAASAPVMAALMIVLSLVTVPAAGAATQPLEAVERSAIEVNT